uniref:Rho guanine nucleotide exchange factor 38 n=1 Tax=Equus caballus TaxID=9796 RepID=A0A9L0SKS0_HORSE
MEPKEATGKETVVTKRKNLPFLRPRLYMLERRKTDTVVESSVSGDHSGALRRSQSDRTEYNQKLQEKMTPQAGGSVAETPTQEEEHQMQRMMAKRSKIIKELIQTERDYLNDLELCVREVVQPLRSKQSSRSCLSAPSLKLSAADFIEKTGFLSVLLTNIMYSLGISILFSSYSYSCLLPFIKKSRLFFFLLFYKTSFYIRDSLFSSHMLQLVFSVCLLPSNLV